MSCWESRLLFLPGLWGLTLNLQSLEVLMFSVLARHMSLGLLDRILAKKDQLGPPLWNKRPVKRPQFSWQAQLRPPFWCYKSKKKHLLETKEHKGMLIIFYGQGVLRHDKKSSDTRKKQVFQFYFYFSLRHEYFSYFHLSIYPSDID